MKKKSANNSKNKKIVVFSTVAIVAALLSVLAIIFFFRDTPNKAAMRYFAALQNNDFQKAYECISSLDKSILSYDDFIKQYSFDEPARKLFLSKSTYKITKTEIEENNAKLSVAITAPDGAAISMSMMADIFPVAMSAAFSKDKETQEKLEKTLQDKMVQKLNEGNIPFSTEVKTTETIKEGGKWFVNLNVKKNKEREKLLDEAKQYEKERKLNKAKEKYEEILKLQGNSVEVEGKIKELDNEIESFKEKQEYIKKITLKNVKVIDYDEWIEKGKAFKGVLVNEGDRTLTEVVIMVYLYDKDNNVIAEEKFYPVGNSFIDGNKPFKPKFVKDFGYKLDKYAPTGWSGKIKVEVVDITFQ